MSRTAFRDDAEFHEAAGPSHLGAAPETARWAEDAEQELKKIPFFVRAKARRNTEKFARERGLGAITVGTLYDAKAHYGR